MGRHACPPPPAWRQPFDIESPTDRVSATVANALRRYKNQITRVEVHLGDENADKIGQRDQRCMVDAHLQGR